MAFIGNVFVILWRLREKMTTYSFCVLNLASMFKVQIYLVILNIHTSSDIILRLTPYLPKYRIAQLEITSSPKRANAKVGG